MTYQRILLSLALCVTAAPAQITVLSDGDFIGWNSTLFAATGSTATFAVVPTGGNPGAYLEASTVSGAVNLAMWSPSLSYDPKVLGPVVAMKFKIDTQANSNWGQGQSVMPVVEQGGRLFVHTTWNITTIPQTWTTLSAGASGTWWLGWDDLSAGEFREIVGLFGGQPQHGCAQPDFAGAPFALGFLIGNSSSGSYVHDYDNVEFTLYGPNSAPTGIHQLGGDSDVCNGAQLTISGSVSSGGTTAFHLGQLGVIGFGTDVRSLPLFGGTLVPTAPVLIATTNTVNITWPAAVPPALPLIAQAAYFSPTGLALTNAVGIY